MSKSLESLEAEINNLQVRLDSLQTELRKAKKQPQSFEVTFKVTTREANWGIVNNLDAQTIEAHFFDFLDEIKEVTNLTDEGDEIKVLSVKEVTNDNA